MKGCFGEVFKSHPSSAPAPLGPGLENIFIPLLTVLLQRGTKVGVQSKPKSTFTKQFILVLFIN